MGARRVDVGGWPLALGPSRPPLPFTVEVYGMLSSSSEVDVDVPSDMPLDRFKRCVRSAARAHGRRCSIRMRPDGNGATVRLTGWL